MASSRSCPSCGARVSQNAERCDLCGHPLSAESEATPDEPDASASEALDETVNESESASPEHEKQEIAEEESAPSSVYCTECGWENPASANFCSQCGTELQDLSATQTPDGTRKVAADLPTAKPKAEGASANRTAGASEKATAEDEEQQMMSQQLMMTVGTAVLVLVALFFVTLWSQNQSWSSDEPSGDPSTQTANAGDGAAAAPGAAAGRFGGQDIATLIAENGTEMSPSVAERADSIQSQIPNVEGDVKRTLQEQLVNLYVGASAFGRAARLQKEMAETSQDPDDWRRTGDLFYNWMEKVGAESNGKNPAIAPIGRRAIAAYEEVLNENPSDHDVRTDMATVLLRSNDPMRGVEELNRVLNEDSTFVPARFNKGIALLWIGRYEQAIEQFEAVQELTGEESAQYQQAAEAIKLVREEMNANQSPASSSEPPISPTS
jgi:cytochrome c-type biogenesis protein CcmH/NrfG/ribosomal protein L40E